MTPDMSVAEMLNSFIFIVKGSRVIDRNATDWSRYIWFDEKLVKHMVYSVTDLKWYFAHRRSKLKWKTVDPFGDWLTHPKRLTAPTLADAMKFADRVARGLETLIDIEAIERNAKARAIQINPPPWVRSVG